MGEEGGRWGRRREGGGSDMMGETIGILDFCGCNASI